MSRVLVERRVSWRKAGMPFLGEMTWKEVEAYLSRRRDLIIPVGSVEEHGFHLPLSTDTIIAEELAKAVESRTGVAVAPSSPYGVCRHTAGYPGTINVEAETLRRLIGDLVEDSHRQGFETHYILTGHAGAVHVAMLREAARKASLKLNVEVFVINPFEMGAGRVTESEGDLHAGEVETSLMLHLRPGLVSLDKAVGGRVKREDFRIALYERPTESGVFGDPSRANEDKGSRIFQGMVEGMVSLIEDKIQGSLK